MAFVAQAADGSTIRYVDGKRHMWLASLTGPLVPIVGVALYFLSGGNALACVFPLAYTFLFVPLADRIFGEDTHNPPEEVVPAMSRDN
jgi:alkane 1-monooxygenase